MRPKLSSGALRVLSALLQYQLEHPYSPTIRDLAKATGLSVGGVQHNLVRLQLMGLLDKTPGITRSIRPLAGARRAVEEWTTSEGGEREGEEGSQEKV